MAENIVLLGFMGSGKTKVGRAVARRLGRRFIDTDRLVSHAANASIPAIFQREGERGFRRRERAAVQEAASATGAVIATGGGVVTDPRNVRILRRTGRTILLDTPVDTLVRRMASSRTRPLADGPDGLRTLYRARRPAYRAAADTVLATRGKGWAQVEAAVAAEADRRLRGTKVRVATDPGYTVHVERGALGDLGRFVGNGARRVVVISHPQLRRAWGARVETGLDDTEWLTFPAGERSKTAATADRLWRQLGDADVHRDDVIVALGGGVVGDVAGFVASTFTRGLAVVHVPTTLLAMVDASIGGKTGINLPAGKNLVGTFHQPLAVVSDPTALTTATDRAIRCGLAEVVKHGFIADPDMLDTVAGLGDDIAMRGRGLERLIARNVRIKAAVVEADERENGVRAYLNYGHTLGHAIETASGGGLEHGEAIAIGLVYAAEVGRRLGGPDLVALHRQTLRTIGLPTQVPDGMTWERLRRIMERDKKHRGGTRMVVLDDLGSPRLRGVREQTLRAAFQAVR